MPPPSSARPAGDLPSVAIAEQAATAIAFLLSGDAAAINGAILPCDCGWSAI